MNSIPAIPQLIAQKDMGRSMTTLSHETQKSRSDAQRPTAEQCSSCSLNAGRRLVNTYEMLELCLLYLTNEDILLAQRVSKRFRSLINNSSRLQNKLFFEVESTAADRYFEAKLNPLFTQPSLQSAIPLFFDHEEKRLTCVYQGGRTRLYCRTVSATKTLVHMDLSSEKPICNPHLTFAEASRRTRVLDEGSWRQMYLSRPKCLLSWRAELTGRVKLRSRCNYTTPRDSMLVYHGYLGEVQGESTLGALLDVLVRSSVVQGI